MMNKPKITYLPQEPVRYSGSVPNLSRRGGVRVHPIKDGGLNPNTHQENIRRRDMAGAKLIDVVDPGTGFCIGVRSNIESLPNYSAGQSKPTREPISGAPTGVLKNLPAKTLVDGAGNRVYLDENGRRIRTTDMGEDMIHAVPVNATPDRSANQPKRVRSVADNGGNTAKPKRATVPGTRTGSSRISDDDVKDFIRALARKAGKPEPTKFTPAMLRDGKVVLAARIKQARKVLGA